MNDPFLPKGADHMLRLADRSADLHRQTTELIRSQARRENELAGRYDAENTWEYLNSRIQEFQETLGENEEIGVQLANYGKAAEIHIRSIGFQNPNLIEFTGLDYDGNDVTLIQHMSQLNFLLVAVKPIEEKPFRIGFTTALDE